MIDAQALVEAEVVVPVAEGAGLEVRGVTIRIAGPSRPPLPDQDRSGVMARPRAYHRPTPPPRSVSPLAACGESRPEAASRLLSA